MYITPRNTHLSWLLSIFAACMPIQPASSSTHVVTPFPSIAPPLLEPQATLKVVPELTKIQTPTLAASLLPVSSNELPAIIAHLPLMDEVGELMDLRLDHDTGYLYVTANNGQLYVLAADTFTLLQTLPVSGYLTLDAPRQRLYVAPSVYDGEFISVIDTETLAIIGTLVGNSMTIDHSGNRLFTGKPFIPYDTADTLNVHIYAADTLMLLGEILQPGIPVYNPLRDEVLIVAHSVYAADPATARITAELLPEIGTQTMPGCNGCLAVQGAYIFPEQNLLALDVTALAAGNGAGVMLEPRWLNATTLEPIIDLATVPPLQKNCGSEVTLQPIIGDHILRNQRFSRYVVHNNLLQLDAAGVEVKRRDGAYARFINPTTRQVYANGGLVLDAQTLSPIGQWPEMCLFAHDAARGLLFGRGSGLDSGTLFIMDEGGAPKTDAPRQNPQSLSAVIGSNAIDAILVSPAFTHDKTLFVTAHNGNLRSNDGGKSWVQLHNERHGGLPLHAYASSNSLTLELTLSPDYGHDHTLFLTGFDGESFGLGVWRSSDGGDSWQPMWDGLSHLRVYDLVVSDNFVEDKTLLAYGAYTHVTPWESGFSIHKSTDGGLTWSLVTTATNQIDLPSAGELLPSASEQVATVRYNASYGQVEHTVDDGQTWSAIVDVFDNGCRVIDMLTVPLATDNDAIYILGQCNVWRTVDGGTTWQCWADERMIGRTYEDYLTAGAITPPAVDHSRQLILGTANGELWVLDLATMKWLPRTSPAARDLQG